MQALNPKSVVIFLVVIFPLGSVVYRQKGRQIYKQTGIFELMFYGPSAE